MNKYQTWKIGLLPSVVVSDTKIKNTNFPNPINPKESLKTDLSYYGGYLVCESVGNSEIANLIAAAPELLRHLEKAVEWNKLAGIDTPVEWIETIEKANGFNVTKVDFEELETETEKVLKDFRESLKNEWKEIIKNSSQIIKSAIDNEMNNQNTNQLNFSELKVGDMIWSELQPPLLITHDMIKEKFGTENYTIENTK